MCSSAAAGPATRDRVQHERHRPFREGGRTLRTRATAPPIWWTWISHCGPGAAKCSSQNASISAVVEPGQVRRLEVGVDPLRPQRVDQRLDHRVGHRPEQVGDRLGHRPEAPTIPAPSSSGPAETTINAMTFLPCQRLGDHRQRRRRHQVTNAVTSSGAPGAQSRKRRSSVQAASAGKKIGPA